MEKEENKPSPKNLDDIYELLSLQTSYAASLARSALDLERLLMLMLTRDGVDNIGEALSDLIAKLQAQAKEAGAPMPEEKA